MRSAGDQQGRRFRIGLAGLAGLILLAGCRAGTVVQVIADVASFLPQNDRAGTLTFVASSGLTAYLLPGLQVDANGATADSQMRGGSLVQLPVPSSVTGVVNTIEVNLKMTLANATATGTTPTTVLSVYAAGGSATDIYVQGTPILTINASPLAAGASVVLSDSVTLSKGDPGYDAFVDPAGVRLGVRIDQAPAATGSTILNYDLTALSVVAKSVAGAFVP